MKKIAFIVIVSALLNLSLAVPAQEAAQACPTVDQAAVGYWIVPAVAQRPDGSRMVTWAPMPGSPTGWSYLVVRQTASGIWFPAGAAIKPYLLDKAFAQTTPAYMVFAVRVG